MAQNSGSRQRTWRILKWTSAAIIVSVALVVAFVAIDIKHRRIAFERLSLRERHLAIYDAFCNQIKLHYFDPSFSGVDWKRIDQEWREKAAAATSDSDLYINVLGNLSLQFPASHIGVEEPSNRLVKPDGAKIIQILGLFKAGPGFDNVLLMARRAYR